MLFFCPWLMVTFLICTGRGKDFFRTLLTSGRVFPFRSLAPPPLPSLPSVAHPLYLPPRRRPPPHSFFHTTQDTQTSGQPLSFDSRFLPPPPPPPYPPYTPPLPHTHATHSVPTPPVFYPVSTPCLVFFLRYLIFFFSFFSVRSSPDTIPFLVGVLSILDRKVSPGPTP